MKGRLAPLATLALEWVQIFTGAPVITSKLQKAVTNPHASGRDAFAICETCVPRERFVAPGIGFDLTSSYGTAAIRYHNGTVMDVGRVDGNEEYLDLMKRLSVPRDHKGPPFDNIFDQIRWQYEKLQRAFRKSRGVPSTDDIRILSEFISRLGSLIARALGESIPARAVVTTPLLPGLNEADLREVFQYKGIELLTSYKHWGTPYEVNSAWAGMGYGLCEHWADIQQCEDEEGLIVPRWALSISFTKKELIVENIFAWNAHAIARYGSARYEHLGFENKDTYNGNTYFWEEVGQKVIEMAEASDNAMESLILMGEHAEEKKFLDTIWKALNDLKARNIYYEIQKPGFNATFIAARGAAELAKRWQGEAWNCIEGDWCREHGELGDDAKMMKA